MKPKSIAIAGTAETTRLGVIPDMSQIQLHADAALNAMADAGLRPSDIDGGGTQSPRMRRRHPISSASSRAPVRPTSRCNSRRNTR